MLLVVVSSSFKASFGWATVTADGGFLERQTSTRVVAERAARSGGKVSDLGSSAWICLTSISRVITPVTKFIRPFIRVITPFITTMGPPCKYIPKNHWTLL